MLRNWKGVKCRMMENNKVPKKTNGKWLLIQQVYWKGNGGGPWGAITGGVEVQNGVGPVGQQQVNSDAPTPGDETAPLALQFTELVRSCIPLKLCTPSMRS